MVSLRNVDTYDGGTPGMRAISLLMHVICATRCYVTRIEFRVLWHNVEERHRTVSSEKKRLIKLSE